MARQLNLSALTTGRLLRYIATPLVVAVIAVVLFPTSLSSNTTTSVAGVSSQGPSGTITDTNMTGNHWLQLDEQLGAGQRLVLSGAFLADLAEDLTSATDGQIWIGLPSGTWSNTAVASVSDASMWLGGVYIALTYHASSTNPYGLFVRKGTNQLHAPFESVDELSSLGGAFIELDASGDNYRIGISHAEAADDDPSVDDFDAWGGHKKETGDQGYGITNADVKIFFKHHGANLDYADVDWTALTEINTAPPTTTTTTTTAPPTTTTTTTTVPPTTTTTTTTAPPTTTTTTTTVPPTTTVPFVHSFVDVPVDGWRGEAVSWMQASGVTNGCSASEFCPDAQMTREQQLTFLYRYAGAPALGSSHPFTDVSGGRYYSDAVSWAYNEGVTTGVSPTLFGTGAAVTRGQAVTFLWRQAGSPVPVGSNPFTDVSGGRYYSHAVIWAFEQGVTTGMSPVLFGPEYPVSRVQFAAFLSRYDGLGLK